MSAPINLEDYKPTDPYFGKAYIDRDEWREAPFPNRNIHGGFAGTDTRFTFYFPAQEHYKNRMFQPIEGAHAGHEEAFGGAMGLMLGGLPMIARLGGFMVESNAGHIGDTIDEKAGPDPTLYGHRASVETARLSKFVAAQVYGAAPKYSYVWGGSGGGRRSPLCLEYGAGVYDGALPFMGGGNVEEHGTTSRVRSDGPVAFGSMFNVQRVLRDKMESVVDAMQPGGSGNPFAGLNTHQAEELANLYRLGYPRGDEYMISQPMGQAWLWCSIADLLQEEDADYFDAFWTKPGYAGHDQPWLVNDDLINIKLKVKRVITAKEMLTNPAYSGPEYARARPMAAAMSSMSGRESLPLAVELEGVGSGYRLGTGVRILSGKAAGRQLYCLNHGGNLLFCDGRDDANILRFTDVEPGDEVHVDNRAFLAYCYYYRHHASADAAFDFTRLDGQPIYPQHGVPLASPLMGVPYSGQYEGKLMWVHHTHDASLWPSQGLIYERAVKQAQGEAKAAEKFCLRWVDNAEHLSPAFLPSPPNRSTATWLVDYMPYIEQSLADLCTWVEHGIKPVQTNYQFIDGKVILPATAKERLGIQPVLTVRANGEARIEVPVGKSITVEVHAEVPPNAGTIVGVLWDFDGTGKFPVVQEVDGKQTEITLTTTHTYDKPGTYFATAQVLSHRDGDVKATSRRVPNLASARVVVK
ncbi:MAG: hypothetical protein JWM78_2618 [Verrucomicrobiaceae bacterium]|nr:hypothetical protein [Verrucomicrobiaceae bacterium]